MLYRKIAVNFKDGDAKKINPTDLYIRGQKVTLNPIQREQAKRLPKKVIKKENPNLKNIQIIKTTEGNERFIFSKGFKNYLSDLWKSGRYSPVHLLTAKDRPSFISKVKDEYKNRSFEYKGKRDAKNKGKTPSVKDDIFAGWDETKSVVFTAFSNLVKPAGKAVLEKVGTSAVSMTKSFNLDGMIKSAFEKMGIPLKDVKKEGELTVTGNDKYEHLNGYFFRCRGSKGVKDFVVFTSIGVGGKVVMTVLGIGAAGVMMTNPLTAPIGCILMAMGAKKGFETIVFDSPKKFASIVISLLQGIKDKNTNIKIADKDGNLTENGIRAIENEVNNELPRLITNVSSGVELPGLTTNISERGGLPGMETQINNTWNNLSQKDRDDFEDMYDVFLQNREIQRSSSLEESFEQTSGSSKGLSSGDLLRGVSTVDEVESTPRKFQERFGKLTDPNQKQQIFKPKKYDTHNFPSSSQSL